MDSRSWGIEDGVYPSCVVLLIEDIKGSSKFHGIVIFKTYS
jgi:hypothetical protein